MKIKWNKGKITFVLIPDANRPVLRARIPRSALYVVPIIAALILLMTLTWLYFKKTGYTDTINGLSRKITDQKKRAEQVVSNKNETIESLQTNIMNLSRQADEVKAKLSDLKKLEEQLRSISSLGNRSTAQVQAQNEGRTSSAQVGIGGINTTISDQQLDDYIEQTSSSFQTLRRQMSDLSGTLSEMLETLQARRHLLQITPSIWPADGRSITSGFGVRRDPFTHKPSFHGGIDIDGETGDPVYTTAEGKVEYAGTDGQHGLRVIINHTRGIRTEYMHLSRSIVSAGEEVQKGQQIGMIGSTGRSTGPHLHYEVHLYGKQVNPMSYIPH